MRGEVILFVHGSKHTHRVHACVHSPWADRQRTTIIMYICNLGNNNCNQHAGSNHTARFHNVSTGAHILRIVAENSKQDRLVMRIKIYVSGPSPSCAVNLINNRILQAHNSITILFKGTNSVDRFMCSLDKQEPFECKYYYTKY